MKKALAECKTKKKAWTAKRLCLKKKKKKKKKKVSTLTLESGVRSRQEGNRFCTLYLSTLDFCFPIFEGWLLKYLRRHHSVSDYYTHRRTVSIYTILVNK